MRGDEIRFERKGMLEASDMHMKAAAAATITRTATTCANAQHENKTECTTGKISESKAVGINAA